MRSWTIEDTGSRPLTLNAARKMNRYEWAAHTKATRGVWFILTRKAGVPAIDCATITVEPLHKNFRSPQDVSAAAAGAKAAIDGIVDAGVLADDDPTHLLAVTFLPPHICGRDGMRLTITEATR